MDFNTDSPSSRQHDFARLLPINLFVKRLRDTVFALSLRFFYIPAFPFYSIFRRLRIRFFHTGISLLMEKNMDWMDGMAALAIALLWLVTWASVEGCVKLGAQQ